MSKRPFEYVPDSPNAYNLERPLQRRRLNYNDPRLQILEVNDAARSLTRSQFMNPYANIFSPYNRYRVDPTRVRQPVNQVGLFGPQINTIQRAYRSWSTRQRIGNGRTASWNRQFRRQTRRRFSSATALATHFPTQENVARAADVAVNYGYNFLSARDRNEFNRRNRGGLPLRFPRTLMQASGPVAISNFYARTADRNAPYRNLRPTPGRVGLPSLGYYRNWNRGSPAA